MKILKMCVTVDIMKFIRRKINIKPNGIFKLLNKCLLQRTEIIENFNENNQSLIGSGH